MQYNAFSLFIEQYDINQLGIIQFIAPPDVTVMSPYFKIYIYIFYSPGDCDLFMLL